MESSEASRTADVRWIGGSMEAVLTDSFYCGRFGVELCGHNWGLEEARCRGGARSRDSFARWLFIYLDDIGRNDKGDVA